MISDQDFQNLKNELEELKSLYYKDVFSALQIIRKQQKLLDGINFEVGSFDGTMLGTQITQKIGLWGNTPVDQPATVSDPGDVGGVYSQAEVQAIVDAVKAIIDRLQEPGLIA